MMNKELRIENKIPFWLLICVFLALTPGFLTAADEEEGIKTSSELQLIVSSLPEVQLGFSQSFIFPFLRGSNPLTEGNNITAVLSAELTPLSLNGIGEVIWTPAAFSLLSGGGMIGSGWNIPLGSGIGINAPKDKGAPVPGPSDPPRKAKIYGEAFDGLLWSVWGAGTLQFDLGAIIPGDWTHVLFQTRQEFRYAAYTGASAGEPWVLKNDDAENQNGWIYYASYVLGYQMPLSPVLDTIAFMAEVNKSLYNTPNGDYWGDGLGKWIFSGIFNFNFHPRFSTALIVQMRTRRNHGNVNLNNNDYYYRDLKLESSEGKRRIPFYRVLAIFSYKIH